VHVYVCIYAAAIMAHIRSTGVWREFVSEIIGDSL